MCVCTRKVLVGAKTASQFACPQILHGEVEGKKCASASQISQKAFSGKKLPGHLSVYLFMEI